MQENFPAILSVCSSVFFCNRKAKLVTGETLYLFSFLIPFNEVKQHLQKRKAPLGASLEFFIL